MSMWQVPKIIFIVLIVFRESFCCSFIFVFYFQHWCLAMKIKWWQKFPSLWWSRKPLPQSTKTFRWLGTIFLSRDHSPDEEKSWLPANCSVGLRLPDYLKGLRLSGSCRPDHACYMRTDTLSPVFNAVWSGTANPGLQSTLCEDQMHI